MGRFEVKKDFLLDQKPFKILSGAIHYFRVHPDDWYHSLYNLKALGFNTVETYLPWNLHEPKQGQFHFEGILDIERFLQIAQDLGLYAIVRPSPYICAEWEFGGLPAWLLAEKVRIRSSDPAFMAHVARYYDILIPKLAKRQLDQGGNILMVQVENEFGSYSEDKAYLRQLRQLLEERGITCPLFTSDGPWQATLRAGSLIEDDVLTTGNFGSRASENFQQMQAFFKEHKKEWPLMCMEFWDGWFNRWKEPIIRRDPEELAEAVHQVLEYGSINLYMFHGGTNFGYMNGCSARGPLDLPQVTSYDYDALLDEVGNPREKYYAVQRMMTTFYPEYPTYPPLVKTPAPLMEVALSNKVSLFETLETIGPTVHSLYPQSMKELGQEVGYLLYRTQDRWDAPQEPLRLIDGRDRAQVFIDQKWVATQYQDEIGNDIYVEAEKDSFHTIDILMENMGRVNYGHKLLADTQDKGLRQGMMKDLHFVLDWQHILLEDIDPDQIDFSKDWQPQSPAFYAFNVKMKALQYAYIDLSGFGKGVVWVNGFHIGRFWNVGPTLSLYLPQGLLKEGDNQIVIFETEGIYSDKLRLVPEPIFKEVEGENL